MIAWPPFVDLIEFFKSHLKFKLIIHVMVLKIVFINGKHTLVY
jgi:hypothetical protein